MRVFKLNEYDWVAAETMEEAIEWYLKETGLSREDAIDEPEEEEYLDSKMRVDEAMDSEQITLKEQISRHIQAGEPFPLLLCSTEF